jgi:hypothetical protein
MLAFLEVLKYSETITKILGNKIINSGDKIEIEIRGASIWAVEVKRKFREFSH